MTTRCTFLRAAAFMLAVLALWAMPSDLRAQDDRCVCDHYTVVVDPALACKVTVCIQRTPSGPTICQTYSPGDKFEIPCPVYEVSVQLCNGSIVLVPSPPVIARCTDIFHIERDCCARVCRGTDEKGCPVFEINAAACVNDVCP